MNHRRSLSALVLLLTLGTDSTKASAAELVPLEVVVSVTQEGGPPLKGRVVLTERQGEKSVGEPTSLEIQRSKGEVTARAVTSLPLGSVWNVALEVPGYWAAPRVVTVSRGEARTARAEFAAWPLGMLEGRVVTRGQKPPRELLVTTLAAPKGLGRPEAPSGTIPCPVDVKTGAWSCSLPAATYDLALGAQGLIPLYRWGVVVPPSKPLALGDLAFEAGSSVGGWVVIEGEKIDPERCRVRLISSAPGADPSAMVKLQQTGREARVGAEGAFQFAGVSNGSFVVEVEQPGFSPARSEPIAIRQAGDAVFLREPLFLVRPFSVSLAIQPARDPFGGFWSVILSRADENLRYGAPSFEGRSDGEGRLVAKAQRRGTYRIDIRDSRENRIHAESDVPIDGETDRIISLDFVELQGTISLGERPLAASLWFGGKHGAESISFESDSEGKFSGVLPSAGLWTAEIKAERSRVQSIVRVDVQPDRDGLAEVEIVLPDTTVRGRVIGPDGRPVPQASIVGFVLRPEGGAENVDERADGDGAFTIRGLPLGTVTLEASGNTGLGSEPVRVELSSGAEVGPIDLVLREDVLFHGVVTSAGGPLGGALVFGFAREPAASSGGRSTTDTTGAFSLRLPKGTRRAQFLVGAPGYAFQSFEVPLGEGPSLLAVSPVGGTLEIAGTATLSPTLQIFQGGQVLPLPILGTWARAQGSIFDPSAEQLPIWRIPALAPGDYRICLLGGPCEQGSLTLGGVLRMELNTPSAPTEAAPEK